MAVISMIMALKVQYVRRMVKEMTIAMAWNIKLTNMNMGSLQEIVTRSMPLGKTSAVSYSFTPRRCHAHIVANAGQN